MTCRAGGDVGIVTVALMAGIAAHGGNVALVGAAAVPVKASVALVTVIIATEQSISGGIFADSETGNEDNQECQNK